MTSKIFLILFCLTVAASAQTKINGVYSNYKLFNYSRVISIADSLLLLGDLDPSEQLTVLMYRGASYYSIAKDSLAEESFRNVLKLNLFYKPDSNIFSPKIVNIVNNLRVKILLANKPTEHDRSTSLVANSTFPFKENRTTINANNEMLLSFVLPGSGQINRGEYFKGITLLTFSTISLAGFVYFYFQSSDLYNEYLGSLNTLQSKSRLDDYQTSVRNRNIAFGSMLFLWLLTQLDLYVFHSPQTDYLQIGKNYLEFKYRL